ncbi:hypothetical protein GCM10010329_80370 [Streptomyces spiroverticillatus]|uniref:Uncharacterized protein n=1 Tax=Streptomyces finlayi TaxID=67296 RepID=A0A919CEN1_9ACTN|nr:hypothetical protein GCM10010329_80370 [Streptomyces spiroverticillatus]GHD15846.1 hypothetical protein GCM10010334_76290 [Streptomyces finlayi]
MPVVAGGDAVENANERGAGGEGLPPGALLAGEQGAGGGVGSGLGNVDAVGEEAQEWDRAARKVTAG